jgi:hypothetical protein
MGTSKKIVLGLMLLLFTSITINGFWLKKQFHTIDKSDLFWEFEKRKELPKFSHINIEGGNKIYISIVDGLDSRLYYKNEWATDFTSKLNSDTLTITFSADLFTKRIKGKRWKSYRIVIECNNLKSLTLHNSYVDLELKSKDSLKIASYGYSIVKIKSPDAKINSMDVKLSGNSRLVFSDEQKPLQAELMTVKILDSSFLNLNKTRIRHFLPFLGDDARILYGSGIETYENNLITNDYEQ